MRGHLSTSPALVHVHHFMSVDGEHAVGVDGYTEETGIGLWCECKCKYTVQYFAHVHVFCIHHDNQANG